MHFQIVVLAIVILCGALTVNARIAEQQQALFNYMMQSRAGPNDGDCFTQYMQTLNDILAVYEKDYGECTSTATKATDSLIELGDESRKDITTVSEDVCKKFIACKNEAENLNFFDCSSNLGDQSVVIYNASKDASESAANYREVYRTIVIQEQRCKNETDRVYVNSYTEAYAVLINCFQYGIVTEAPKTPSATTDVTTTSSPVTVAAAQASAPKAETLSGILGKSLKVEDLKAYLISRRKEQPDWLGSEHHA